jgi:hypothetical protein
MGGFNLDDVFSIDENIFSEIFLTEDFYFKTYDE